MFNKTVPGNARPDDFRDTKLQELMKLMISTDLEQQKKLRRVIEDGLIAPQTLSKNLDSEFGKDFAVGLKSDFGKWNDMFNDSIKSEKEINENMLSYIHDLVQSSTTLKHNSPELDIRTVLSSYINETTNEPTPISDVSSILGSVSEDFKKNLKNFKVKHTDSKINTIEMTGEWVDEFDEIVNRLIIEIDKNNLLLKDSSGIEKNNILSKLSILDTFEKALLKNAQNETSIKSTDSFKQLEEHKVMRDQSNVFEDIHFDIELTDDFAKLIKQGFKTAANGSVQIDIDKSDLSEHISLMSDVLIQQENEFRELLQLQTEKLEQEKKNGVISTESVERLEIISEAISTVTNIEQELLTKYESLPSVLKDVDKIKPLQNQVKNNLSLAALDAEIKKSTTLFGVLQESSKKFASGLETLDAASEKMAGVFDGVDAGIGRNFTEANNSISRIGELFSSVGKPLAMFAATAALAANAIKTFHERLDVDRSYNGNGDLTDTLKNIELTTHYSPEEMKQLSESISGTFGMSLNHNRKDLEKIALKKRLSEKVMGKEYAENQMEAMESLKDVMSSNSPMALMEHLSGETSVLAKTMGVSNKLALQQIKAIAENTKELTKGMSQDIKSQMQDTITELTVGLRANMSEEAANNLVKETTETVQDDEKKSATISRVNNISKIPGFDKAQKFLQSQLSMMGETQTSSTKLMSKQWKNMDTDERKRAVRIQAAYLQVEKIAKMEAADKKDSATTTSERVHAQNMQNVVQDGSSSELGQVIKIYKNVIGSSKKQKAAIETNKILKQSQKYNKTIETILLANGITKREDKTKGIEQIRSQFGPEKGSKEDKKYNNVLLKALKAKAAGATIEGKSINTNGKTVDEIKAYLAKSGMTQGEIQSIDIDAFFATMGETIEKKISNAKSTGQKDLNGLNISKFSKLENDDKLDVKRMKLNSTGVENTEWDATTALIKANKAMEEGILGITNIGLPAFDKMLSVVSNNLGLFGVALVASSFNFKPKKLFKKIPGLSKLGQIGTTTGASKGLTSKFFSSITGFFKKMPGMSKVGGVVGKVTGGTSKIAGGLGKVLGIALKPLGALGKMIPGVGWMMAATQAVTGAMDGFKNAGKIFQKDKIDKKMNLKDAKKFGAVGRNDQGDFIDKYGELVRKSNTFSEKLSSSIGGALSSLTMGFADAGKISHWLDDTFSSTFGSLGTTIDKMKESFGFLGDTLNNFFSGDFDAMEVSFDAFTTSFSEGVSAYTSLITNYIKDLTGITPSIDGIKTAFSDAITTLSDKFTAVGEWFGKLKTWISKKFSMPSLPSWLGGDDKDDEKDKKKEKESDSSWSLSSVVPSWLGGSDKDNKKKNKKMIETNENLSKKSTKLVLPETELPDKKVEQKKVEHPEPIIKKRIKPRNKIKHEIELEEANSFITKKRKQDIKKRLNRMKDGSTYKMANEKIQSTLPDTPENKKKNYSIEVKNRRIKSSKRIIDDVKAGRSRNGHLLRIDRMSDDEKIALMKKEKKKNSSLKNNKKTSQHIIAATNKKKSPRQNLETDKNVIENNKKSTTHHLKVLSLNTKKIIKPKPVIAKKKIIGKKINIDDQIEEAMKLMMKNNTQEIINQKINQQMKILASDKSTTYQKVSVMKKIKLLKMSKKSIENKEQNKVSNIKSSMTRSGKTKKEILKYFNQQNSQHQQINSDSTPSVNYDKIKKEFNNARIKRIKKRYNVKFEKLLPDTPENKKKNKRIRRHNKRALREKKKMDSQISLVHRSSDSQIKALKENIGELTKSGNSTDAPTDDLKKETKHRDWKKERAAKVLKMAGIEKKSGNSTDAPTDDLKKEAIKQLVYKKMVFDESNYADGSTLDDYINIAKKEIEQKTKNMDKGEKKKFFKSVTTKQTVDKSELSKVEKWFKSTKKNRVDKIQRTFDDSKSIAINKFKKNDEYKKLNLKANSKKHIISHDAKHWTTDDSENVTDNENIDEAKRILSEKLDWVTNNIKVKGVGLDKNDLSELEDERMQEMSPNELIEYYQQVTSKKKKAMPDLTQKTNDKKGLKSKLSNIGTPKLNSSKSSISTSGGNKSNLDNPDQTSGTQPNSEMLQVLKDIRDSSKNQEKHLETHTKEKVKSNTIAEKHIKQTIAMTDVNRQRNNNIMSMIE